MPVMIATVVMMIGCCSSSGGVDERLELWYTVVPWSVKLEEA